MESKLHRTAPGFGALALSSLMLSAAIPSTHAVGRVVAWGLDNYGQVSQPPTGHDFIEISVGGVHRVTMRSDGSLAVWSSQN